MPPFPVKYWGGVNGVPKAGLFVAYRWESVNTAKKISDGDQNASHGLIAADSSHRSLSDWRNPVLHRKAREGSGSETESGPSTATVQAKSFQKKNVVWEVQKDASISMLETHEPDYPDLYRKRSRDRTRSLLAD